MSEPCIVAVSGIGLWIPGYPSVAAWSAGTPDPEADAPRGRALDRINRRRAGTLGRAIADSAAEAMGHADIDSSTVSTIVGSSIGEASTMIGLLEQMWRAKEPVSPAAFTVSVHNASSGLLSISTKNHGYVTSLAADEDTPAVALLEGIGLTLQRQAPVLVVCGDEEAPKSLVRDAPHWGMLAAALVLTPLSYERPQLARLGIVGPSAASSPTLPSANLDAQLSLNPQAGIIDLIDAILRKKPGHVALDRGLGRGYQASLEFAAE